MSLSTAVLGWAINTEHFAVASAGIIAFVVSFAIGLGPVPFVLVGELPPKEVRPLPARPSLLSLPTPPRALADSLTDIHHPVAGKLGDRLDRRRRQLAEQPRRRDRLPPPARLARRLARQERQRLLPLYSAHGARRRCSLSARAVTRWRSLSSSRRDVSESGCGRSRSRTALWAAALPTTDKSCSAFRHASELETVERARAEAVQTQLAAGSRPLSPRLFLARSRCPTPSFFLARAPCSLARTSSQRRPSSSRSALCEPCVARLATLEEHVAARSSGRPGETLFQQQRRELCGEACLRKRRRATKRDGAEPSARASKVHLGAARAHAHERQG